MDPANTPPTSPDPDLNLVRAMAQGDKSALETLYQHHAQAVLAYLLGMVTDREVAEEILQDVMLAAWRGAGGFRGESRVRTWLIAIARLKALTWLRRRKPAKAELHENLAADDTGPLLRVERRSEHDRVRAALRQLPHDQRETLELVFYHDMTGAEAARLLGVSPGTIKSRVHRAKNTLRGILLQKEVE